MNHINKIIDADPHFTIDPISRRIRNESSKKVTLIQGDHNSERFSFELPRFVEGHDMLECNRVEVHFINIENGTGNRHEDMFDVKDMQIHPDNPEHVAFSWLITDNATKYVGSLAFGIRFCCTDTDNVADYVWKTAVNKDIKISEGMNTAESVAEEFPDIIAQWEERIFGDVGDAVENINTAKTEALKEINDVLKEGKETFATKEELHTRLGQGFADYVEQNFATKEELADVSGGDITVDDNLDDFSTNPVQNRVLAEVITAINDQISLIDARRTNVIDGYANTDEYPTTLAVKNFVESEISDIETSLENIIEKYGLGGDVE